MGNREISSAGLKHLMAQLIRGIVKRGALLMIDFKDAKAYH